jgi:hypothetical protein
MPVSLEDFVDSVASGETSEVEGDFDVLMKQRLADLLDKRREEIAMRMFDGETPDPEESEDE